MPGQTDKLMTDILGYRLKVGSLLPSTNSSVEPEIASTSMAVARLVEDFETQFGKPVISVNIACWWATLRTAGIDDTLQGFGRLFREH